MSNCTTTCQPDVVTTTVVQPVETRQTVVQMAQTARRVVVKEPVTTDRVALAPSPTSATTTVTDPVEVVQIVGRPGPPGPAGPPGPSGGSAVQLPSGETIFGLRAVRAAGGSIYHPDTSVADHAEQVMGIALQSGTGLLNVQTSGLLTEGSWSWAPGLVYCGADGTLTQAPSTTGWLLAVGRAIGPDTIEVDIDTAFFRG